MVTAAAIPLSLLWDIGWESTVGIDYFWAAPHANGYAAVLLAAMLALSIASRSENGVPLGRCRAPLGAWVILWGALVLAGALMLDRWWQVSYGLIAGIWPPPQILKAVAFFAVILGVWSLAPPGALSAIGSGSLLALIGVVTLAASFANQQHGATFYELACALYPAVLVAAAVTGQGRFPATLAALSYTALWLAAVWLLPLLPGSPLVSPIFNPRDHLLPPPFPLLLIVPAVVIDCLLHRRPSSEGSAWLNAVELGLAFGAVFIAVQWSFATFLLSPAAAKRFFASGGREWPFFLQIHPTAKQAFWDLPADALTASRAFIALLLAILSARVGLWIGEGMKAFRR
jgi:hypothetical protein